ncbi:hypothetical protein NSU_3404 [Novosphingobium pentaromativorans US6-1]|uniref:Uncharacterized protein n=1 Tax=Novosphingobium pentaromativorans US6-1 TaxID=1088721 RepID=G6EGD4_9SPHN|nr:hypothetical protein NSU_3404 [Novosphingobium pentaromativorans US6-1]
MAEVVIGRLTTVDAKPPSVAMAQDRTASELSRQAVCGNTINKWKNPYDRFAQGRLHGPGMV